jgi:hypothetical protein
VRPSGGAAFHVDDDDFAIDGHQDWH